MWERVRFDLCRDEETGRYYILYYLEPGWQLQDFSEVAEEARHMILRLPSDEQFDAVFILDGNEHIDGLHLFGELMRISTDPLSPRVHHTSIIGLSTFSCEVFASAFAVVQKIQRHRFAGLSFYATIEEAMSAMKLRDNVT